MRVQKYDRKLSLREMGFKLPLFFRQKHQPQSQRIYGLAKVILVVWDQSADQSQETLEPQNATMKPKWVIALTDYIMPF